MNKNVKLTGICFVFLLLGTLTGTYWSHLNTILTGHFNAYDTTDLALLEQFQAPDAIDIDWQSLLPEQEKSVLQSYQQIEQPDDFAQQLALSIQAANDEAYRSAMFSINTVAKFDNQSVKIPGFIVPIEYHEDKSPSLIFIVPYYGACLHYPPPPPNQIIFARLEAGFSDFDMTQAYTFKGIIKQELFEDPMATSAYSLDIVSVKIFNQEPDDFRSHTGGN